METFSFIWAKLDKLFAFLQFGIEEIVRLSQYEGLNDLSTSILEFLTKFKANSSEYYTFMMQEVFGEEHNTCNI